MDLDWSGILKNWDLVAVIKAIIGAGSAAALFASYKIWAGYHYVNLSMELELRRSPSRESAIDDVVVIVKLAKGKTATLVVEDLNILADLCETDELDEREELTQKIKTELVHLKSKRPLNLAPEEKAQFACHFIWPADKICRVEARLKGKTSRPGFRRGWGIEAGWLASAISLPNPPRD